MRFASLRLRSLALALPFASLAPACGDDEDGETAAETTPITTAAASTSDADPSSTSATTQDDTRGSTSSPSTTADGTADGETADDTTTGSEGDPTYPPIDGGSCPGGTAPIMLPGATLCAPFCGNPEDMCPGAASGDAPALCTPFAGQAGSGDPCDDITPCIETEVCSPGGTCSDVAFWACQLRCDGGQTCPVSMECSGAGTCGYS